MKCYDKFGLEINEDSYLYVQRNGIHKVYKKEDSELYFKPYGNEDLVANYFSNDIILCDKDGNFLIDLT